MPPEQIVVRSDSPKLPGLQADGWVVTARSWGAQANASDVDTDALAALAVRGRDHGVIREMNDADLRAVLELDSATLGDYPGGVATHHAPLTASTAAVTPRRRGFGVFDEAGRAVAITFIDVDIDGKSAETDFTVVAADFRGLGIGSAVKAASVLALLRDGIEVFRTGGAAENARSLALNLRLGYVVDEEWITLSPPLPSL